MRIKVSDVQASRIPQVLGLCSTNIVAICSFLNEAQQRLIGCATETGWWGGWAKVVFPITNVSPYVTIPPQFARIVNLDLCKTPIRVQNSWFEVLVDGIGLQDKCGCGPLQAYDRELVSTAFDLPATNNYLRLYLTDIRDVGARVLFSGAMDANQTGVYSTDALSTVNGFYLTLQTPFVTSAFIVTSFAAISKPVTFGDVVLRSVDATTGTETFLARYTPKETNPAWRRYLVTGVPNCCCATGAPQAPQITAFCKYEFQPVSQPSDFLIIGSIPALKAECESVRYGEMDSGNGAQLSMVKHKEAIKLLNQELQHYEGHDYPAVVVRPYQTIGLQALNLQMQ